MLDDIPEGVSLEQLTTPEQAVRYAKETGADLLSAAVGNIHGMLKHAKNPALHIERIKEVREAGGIPLVLHGGSGVSEEDFLAAIKAGVSTVHVSTELRHAYRKEIQETLTEHPEEISPYRYLRPAGEAVENIVEERMRLF